MSKHKLKISDCVEIAGMINATIRTATEIDGLLVFDLNVVLDAVQKHVDHANETEKKLKERFPFEVSIEQATGIETRKFTGKSADEKADEETKAKRAVLDEENFKKEWDKITEKEVTVEADFEIDREQFASIKGNSAGPAHFVYGVKKLLDQSKIED